MVGSWFALALLLPLAGGAGFAVYERLVRSCAPSLARRAARGAPCGERTVGVAREEASGVRGGRPNRIGLDARSRRDNKEGRASTGELRSPAALDVVVRRIERLLPMTRADGDSYRMMLTQAGWAIEPETWRGLRILSATGCGLLACAALVPSGSQTPLVAGGLVAVAAVLGWTAPRLALARSAVQRRRAIEAQLPDAMELLGIAIAAGSPVEQCFREVAENLEQPLSGEFEAVDREVNLLGHSREQALDHLARRCASRDVAAFVSQLAQAVSQGSSIAKGLSSQAALARETAQATALERIRKMPTKLDMVLSFCFLPPTVALVVVPTVVNLLKFLNDTLQ